jgi:hypothetical protein
LLVNFGERSLKFHRLTNKKFKIITQDWISKIKQSHKSQFRQWVYF